MNRYHSHRSRQLHHPARRGVREERGSSTDTTAAMAPAPAPAPAALSLADVAGKWQMSNVPTSGADTSPTNFVLTATADTTGWVMEFPSGVKVPLQVSVDGDSILTKAGPFASQRRKSTKVTTESVMRLQDGKLVGTTTAQLRHEGRRLGAAAPRERHADSLTHRFAPPRTGSDFLKNASLMGEFWSLTPLERLERLRTASEIQRIAPTALRCSKWPSRLQR